MQTGSRFQSSQTSSIGSLDVLTPVMYNHIVMQPSGYDHERLDATFAALADPTRRAILARLASGDASVTELAAPFAMSQPAISKHLKVLERAGLIVRGQDAQRRPRRLAPQPLAAATAWLESYRQFWEGRFQRLDALLGVMQTVSSKRTGTRKQKSAIKPRAQGTHR